MHCKPLTEFGYIVNRLPNLGTGYLAGSCVACEYIRKCIARI